MTLQITMREAVSRKWATLTDLGLWSVEYGKAGESISLPDALVCGYVTTTRRFRLRAWLDRLRLRLILCRI